MKRIALLTIPISLLVSGCAPSDKYDLAAEKQKNGGHQFVASEMIDSNQIALPEGAKVEDLKIKKGDKLPDGNIATEDTTIKSFSMSTGAKVELSSPQSDKKK